MKLSDDQQAPVDAALSFKWPVILVRGQAGTGKSVVTRAVQEQCENTLTVTSKGLSAANIGGMTIHKAFGIPFGVVPDPEQRNVQRTRWSHPAVKFFKPKLLVAARMLIIDECFDVRCDILDFMDNALRSARKEPQKPFGGLHVLMVGDEAQSLPIVGKDKEKLDSFGYRSPYGIEQSKVWREL